MRSTQWDPARGTELTWVRVLTQPKAPAWAGSISVFEVEVAVIIVLCVIAIRTRSSARWLPVALAIAALALAPSLVIVLVVVRGVQVAKHLRLAWTCSNSSPWPGPGSPCIARR